MFKCVDNIRRKERVKSGNSRKNDVRSDEREWDEKLNEKIAKVFVRDYGTT